MQQGDPLGPFLFSLALQSCLVEAQAAFGSGFVISYLDDAIIAGLVDSVVSSFTILRQCMQEVGLIVRPDKCEELSLQADASWPLHDIAFTTSGMSVLGCPIGSNAYVAEECERIVAKENTFLERLCGLRNMQSLLLLLRYCGTGRINHLLRAIPPSIIQPAVQQHDSNIRSCFCSIIGCQLDDTRIHQLHLRLSQGGLGLPLAERTSPCAFLGAWAATLASLPQRLENFHHLSTSPSIHRTTSTAATSSKRFLACYNLFPQSRIFYHPLILFRTSMSSFSGLSLDSLWMLRTTSCFRLLIVLVKLGCGVRRVRTRGHGWMPSRPRDICP